MPDFALIAPVFPKRETIYDFPGSVFNPISDMMRAAPTVLKGEIHKDQEPLPSDSPGGGFWGALGQIGGMILNTAVTLAPVALSLYGSYLSAKTVAERQQPKNRPIPLNHDSPHPVSINSLMPVPPVANTQAPSLFRQVASHHGAGLSNQDSSPLPSNQMTNIPHFSKLLDTHVKITQPSPAHLKAAENLQLQPKVNYRGIAVNHHDLDDIFLTDMTYIGLGVPHLSQAEIQNWQQVQHKHLAEVSQAANVYQQLLNQSLHPQFAKNSEHFPHHTPQTYITQFPNSAKAATPIDYAKRRASVKKNLTEKFNKKLLEVKSEFLKTRNKNGQKNELNAFMKCIEKLRQGAEWDFQHHPELGWPKPGESVWYQGQIVSGAYFGNAAYGIGMRAAGIPRKAVLKYSQFFSASTRYGEKDQAYDQDSIISGMDLWDFHDPWKSSVPYLGWFYLYPLK